MMKMIVMARKRKWRTRTTGTPSQVGQHFVIDEESQQSKKARLPSMIPSRSDWIKKRLGYKTPLQKYQEQKMKEEKQGRIFGKEAPDENNIAELEAEVDEMKEVLGEIKRDAVKEGKKISERLEESSIGKFLKKKKEEREDETSH